MLDNLYDAAWLQCLSHSLVQLFCTHNLFQSPHLIEIFTNLKIRLRDDHI